MSAAPERTVPALESRVRPNKEVLFQELQGEAVLLNLSSGMYFGLDPVGTRIWQLIGEHGKLSDVVQVMVDEFEVGEDRCAADLLALVAELQENDLVTLAD